MAKRPLIAIDGVAKTYRTADGPVLSLKPLTFAIGEGFAGEGANAAHVNTVLGETSGPVGVAWATALATPVLMDAGKARRELGWEPRFDAAETLIQTAVSAREAGLLD